MVKIEVHSAELQSFQWNDKKGVLRTGYKQSAWAHLDGKPHPVEIKLRVDDPSKAYAPGVYELGPRSFYTDRYGALCVSPVLVPATRGAAAKAVA